MTDERRADFDKPAVDPYLADRQLARGTAGWPLLAALGVSYVVAGDYAAWNYGLALSGWGGMAAALALMAIMYLCLVFSLAELAAAIPTAGGAYAFARRAFGPAGGFLAGALVIVEYVALTGALSIFLGSYFTALTGLRGGWIYFVFYALFLTIHVWGVGEALKLLLGLSIVAVAGLAVFSVTSAHGFSPANLLLSADGSPGGSLLPFGAVGIWTALPFGMAFFLALEGVPLASEETRDPARNVPRGMLVAWGILTLLAIVILVCGPGVAGIPALMKTDSPLVDALRLQSGRGLAAGFVNVAGLVALAASLFSTIYAYSRQIFALSRAGYLPRILSLTNRRKSPWLAILIPGVFALLLALGGKAEPLVVMGVFCATASYLVVLAAFIRLRRTEPDMARPYRTPGGRVTAGFAFVLALAAFLACLAVNLAWSFAACVIVGLMMTYFWVFSRHRLVANAPEEEFAAIRAAAGDLN